MALAPSCAYGVDRVPASGGLVVASNHFNAIDPVLAAASSARALDLLDGEDRAARGAGGRRGASLARLLRRAAWVKETATRLRVARWARRRGPRASGFFIGGHPAAARLSRRRPRGGSDDRDPGGRPGRAVRHRHVPVVAAEPPAMRASSGASRSISAALPRNGKGYKEGAGDRRRGDPRALAPGR